MKKVLTIDDSKALRSIINRCLKPFGIDVVEAENGAVGLDRAQAEKPDLILLDFHMPVMDGFETLETLKSQPDLATIPVIMLTTEAGEHTVLKLLKLGVKDYVIKPFERADILKPVNEYLNLFAGGVIPSDEELEKIVADGAKPTILVVDDKENILKLVGEYVDTDAYNVETAQGGYAAIAAMKQSPPKILFLDIDMPGMSGIEFYDKTKSIIRENEIKIAGLVLRTDEERKTQAQQIGIRDFLQKPFSKQDVARVLVQLSGAATFLTDAEGVKVLDFPDAGDLKLQRFKYALKTDVVREINDLAAEGRNQLVVKLSDAITSDLGLVQNFTALLAHLDKLVFEVRLVAETDEAKEGLNQYLEISQNTTYSSVAEAVESFNSAA